MNNKGLAASIAVVLVVLVLIIVMGKNNTSPQGVAEHTTETATTVTEEAEATETVAKQETTTASEEDQTTAEMTTEVQETTTKEDTSQTTQSTERETVEEDDTLYVDVPFEVPGTNLVITYINGYTGLYIENGQDEDIKNVLAIRVKNESERPLEYGQITMGGKNKLYEFSFSNIPAGESVIVMEANKQKYKSNIKYHYVTSSFAFIDELDLMEDEIDIEVVENNGIKVTNLTDGTIPTTRIFYKYQMDSGEYVGGITYTSKIENLKPGEPMTVYPSHFDSEGSRVMMVRTYDN